MKVKVPDIQSILILASLSKGEAETLVTWMKSNSEATLKNISDLEKIRLHHGLSKQQIVDLANDTRALITDTNRLAEEALK